MNATRCSAGEQYNTIGYEVRYYADAATGTALLRRLPLQRITSLHGRRVIILRTYSNGRYISFLVRDYGPGPPPRNLLLPRMLPFAAP